jgi:glycosyltransferase involved in cell wall biosynthesis
MLAVFAQMQATFEIIMVDDASPNPEVWPLLASLDKGDPRIHCLQLMKNAGQHNATICGLRAARGRFIVMMDDDLQHLPEELPKMVAKLAEAPGYDAVLGKPNVKEHSSLRNKGSLLINHLLGLALNKPKGIVLTSFRLINRELCDAILTYRGHIITLGSLICTYTRNIANVEVEHAPRKYEKSGYSLAKLISLALSNIFNFSAMPLVIISWFGFFLSLLAVLYSVYIMYMKLTGRIGQAGFSTIVVLVSLYSGIILFSMGILGQYILRILRTTTSHQQYVIRRGGDGTSGE